MTTTVGLLYPGYAAEDDFPLLASRLGPDVRLPVVHTSVGEDAHRVDALLDLGSPERLAEGAEALRSDHPDSVMWACTSGSFVFGWDGALAQTAGVAELLGVPVSSTSIAFAEACTALNVRRVAVAATYPDDVARHFVEFLGKAGVDVLRMSAEGIITATEVGTFGRERVVELVTANDHPDAEAILVPDTALHSVAWLEELEAAAGKPVLTANQVTAWEGLRIAGHTAGHDGLGRLFRHQGVR